MAKTILVPTDFTIRSLYTLKQALHNNDSQSLNIIFFCGYNLKDSIMDLLFFSTDSIIADLVEKDFRQACQIIQNKYATRINSIRFEIFTGFTQAAFNNFTEANAIDELYIPGNKLHFSPKCFDPLPYMRRNPLLKIMVSWPEGPEQNHENRISELFTSWT